MVLLFIILWGLDSDRLIAAYRSATKRYRPGNNRQRIQKEIEVSVSGKNLPTGVSLRVSVVGVNAAGRRSVEILKVGAWRTVQLRREEPRVSARGGTHVQVQLHFRLEAEALSVVAFKHRRLGAGEVRAVGER